MVAQRGRWHALFVGLLAGLATVSARPAQAQGGVLVQWGNPSQGQTNNAPPPAGPYRAVAAGGSQSLALRADGSLVQWGDTSLGQADNRPPSSGPYTAIAAGPIHSLALRADGSLVQWGNTQNNRTANAPSVAGPYIAIAAGESHSLALRADGSLVQWGNTAQGQANNAPPAAGPYIAIAAGGVHSLALKADGSLVQWGNNQFGQEDNQPPTTGPFIAIAAGSGHSLALRADGSLVQWGPTGFGEDINMPPLAGPYIAISASFATSLALRADRSLVQWGRTFEFQANGAPSPAGPYFAIAAGSSHNLALLGPPPGSVSFTYQGVLKGQNGPVDMRFTLFSAPSGGAPVGAVTQVAGITTDPQGVFTALVQPGTIDASRPLWIEVGVAPAGSGVFTTLTPRQPLTAAPVASVAHTAGTALTATSASSVPWSGITGVPVSVSNPFSPWVAGAGNSISYTAGNVGIGTTSPVTKLHIQGDLNTVNVSPLISTLSLIDSRSGGYFQFMSDTGSETGLIFGRSNFGPVESGIIYNNPASPGGLQFRTGNNIARMTINSAGNVGIGTDTPAQRLTVVGNIQASGTITPSSVRLKDHIAPMSDAMEKLLQLEGVRFDWKPEQAKERGGRVHDLGFVAEEVAKVFPEVVFRDAEGNVTGMDYSRLTAVAVQAIKQLKADQQREVRSLREENVELRARLERLEAKIK
ncbi:MAG: tail fiber domain-containing protein [Phycisphaerales bacterium]|nr:tail fiber domain-containing protein [Phycisphaerales bacterium]